MKNYLLIVLALFATASQNAFSNGKQKKECDADLAEVLREKILQLLEDAKKQAIAETEERFGKFRAKIESPLDQRIRELEEACKISQEECRILKDGMKDELLNSADLKTQLETLKRELRDAKSEIKAAEDLLDSAAKSEQEKADQINALLNQLVDLKTKGFGTSHSGPSSVELKSPISGEEPGLVELVSLKIGLGDLKNDFSKIDSNNWYSFEFARPGNLLKPGIPQTIRFEKHIVKWFQDPGLEIEKGKFLKQLTMGQGSNPADQGMKHAEGEVWEIKIKDRGHWRIFVKQVDPNKWVAFHVTNSLWVGAGPLKDLSSHL